MIEQIEKNIDAEIEMLREISNNMIRMESSSPSDKQLLQGAITSLTESMRMINSAIPSLLNEIALVEKLPVLKSQPKENSPKFEKISLKEKAGIKTEWDITLNSKDKKRFIKELSINENILMRVKKNEKDKGEKYKTYKGSRGYLKIANKFFFDKAAKTVNKGKFKQLSVGIRKANIDVLIESYIAMMYFTVFVTFLVSLIITVLLLFVHVDLSWPFFSLYKGSYISRLLKIFWIPLAITLATFLAIFVYPSTEKGSIERKINDELPFAVIHMSAISGSGIEPSEIFRIIGNSRDYPALRKEIRKIINQINLYGYDLVTALNNTAKTSPSQKLSELLSGLSTTITSGAKIGDFLEKRSESLLLNYRLEREKYTKLVETFLDIYISLVIAAPMIFLLLLVMISISKIGFQLTPNQISLISVLGIAGLNMLFMIILQLRQPSY